MRAHYRIRMAISDLVARRWKITSIIRSDDAHHKAGAAFDALPPGFDGGVSAPDSLLFNKGVIESSLKLARKHRLRALIEPGHVHFFVPGIIGTMNQTGLLIGR